MAAQKSSNCGVSRCSHCNKTNPWRSDFKYAVKGESSAGQHTAVFPGSTGRCRHCGSQEFQDVIAIYDTLEECIAKSDLVIS